MKLKERELTIEDAVSEAIGEIQSLAEEMRDAFDNTPESLQQSPVGEARSEAADKLEGINEPEVPTELQGDKFKIKWSVRALTIKQQMKLSRAARRDEAVSTLGALVERLNELTDDIELSEEDRAHASAFADELQQVIDEVEDVEFPGMYG